tara:strand:+ start:169 stop:996 length:828 start_codon:yes stop_codon:yes gene_type:complete
MVGYKSHAIVVVENEERNLNTSRSATDFIFQLTEPITFSKRSANKQYFMRIEDIRIPISFYNVNSNFNTLTFSDAAALYTAVVPEGNYTIDELIAELQIQMNTVHALTPYTLTYDEKTQKVSITSDGTTTGITTITATNTSSGVVNTLYQIINFSIGQTIADGGTGVADNVAYTNTAKHLRLIIDNITSNNVYSNHRQTNDSIITSRQKMSKNIVITETRNEFQFVENHNGYYMKLPNISSICDFRIRLQDRHNNIVNLNGVPFGFEIVFYEYNK